MSLRIAESSRDANGITRYMERSPTPSEMADIAIRALEENRKLSADRHALLTALCDAQDLVAQLIDGPPIPMERLEEIQCQFACVRYGLRMRSAS
jgi:hypothetical protein